MLVPTGPTPEEQASQNIAPARPTPEEQVPQNIIGEQDIQKQQQTPTNIENGDLLTETIKPFKQGLVLPLQIQKSSYTPQKQVTHMNMLRQAPLVRPQVFPEEPTFTKPRSQIPAHLPPMPTQAMQRLSIPSAAMQLASPVQALTGLVAQNILLTHQLYKAPMLLSTPPSTPPRLTITRQPAALPPSKHFYHDLVRDTVAQTTVPTTPPNLTEHDAKATEGRRKTELLISPDEPHDQTFTSPIATRRKKRVKLSTPSKKKRKVEETKASCKLCKKSAGGPWVQCSECSGWSHINCLGISQEDADEADQFLCCGGETPRLVSYCSLPDTSDKKRKGRKKKKGSR